MLSFYSYNLCQTSVISSLAPVSCAEGLDVRKEIMLVIPAFARF